MAGGNHPKSSSHKPSSSSAASAHRKSRWESGNKPPPPASADKKPSSSSSAAAAANNSNPPTPKPSSTPKHNPPAPKPNTNANPSPNHPKPPSDPTPYSGSAPIPAGAPPPPAYGFHMLERRTIALADGSVRSYFSLPPDYQDFTPPRPVLPHGGLGFDGRFPPLGPMSPEFRDRVDPRLHDRSQDYWNSLRLDGNPLKRKGGGGDEENRGGIDGNDELARRRQQLLQFGNVGSMNPNGYPIGLNERGEFLAGTSNPDIGRGDELRAPKYMRMGGGYGDFHGGIGGGNVSLKHNDVDQRALKNAFLHFVKLVNENSGQKKNYLENGKQAPLQCVACGRSSKDFPDMHGLILHTYSPDRADLLVDHLGLHKALCVLMGWNYSKPPDNSKAYQSLSADEAAVNQDDLIMWPPTVIIHNTHTGKVKDGRLEGLGNKAMDNILRDLGFGSGKAKSVFGREGHLGIVRVQFAADQSGLREAVRLAEFLERENHGRMHWARVQSLTSGKDNESNPHLVKADEKTGEKTRVLYGYLGTAWDLDKLDFESRKKTAVESRREYKPS